MHTSNREKVAAAIAALHDALKTIESAVELKAQTGRLRNLLASPDLDAVIGNCVVSIRLHNQYLKEVSEEG